MELHRIKKLVCFAFLCWSILHCEYAYAQAPLLDDSQWNDQTKLLLAQAFVAEAGWSAKKDHVGIAFVLLGRWKDISQRYPKIAFSEVVRAYCSGFRSRYSKLSPRLKWIRGLNLEAKEPKDWPKKIGDWSMYAPRFVQLLELAERWRLGLEADPCGGMARHFGGSMDVPKLWMIKISCGDTSNTFYKRGKNGEKRYSKRRNGSQSDKK